MSETPSPTPLARRASNYAETAAANADLVTKRESAEALSNSIAQTSGSDLSRHHRDRVPGGTFDALAPLPKDVMPESGGLKFSDLRAFFSGISIAPRTVAPTHEYNIDTRIPQPFGGGAAGVTPSGLPSLSLKDSLKAKSDYWRNFFGS